MNERITTTLDTFRGASRAKIVAGSTVLVVAGGAAFAYWTAGGTGTGSGATATGSEALTVNQTTLVSGLAPGATPTDLTGTFDNPNDAAVAVTTVTGDVTATSNVNCLTTWFDVAGTGTVSGSSVPVGTGVGSWSGLTVALVNDAAVNQDACKGATVTISYTAS